MGLTPREVDRLTLWEFTACAEGFARSKGSEPGKSGDLDEDWLRQHGIAGF